MIERERQVGMEGMEEHDEVGRVDRKESRA